MTRPSVALLTIGDGRDDLLTSTLDTFARYLGRQPGDLLGAFTAHVHVDDREHRLGFAGAIQSGWARLRKLEGFAYVLHVEEDFDLLRPVSLGAMAALLDAQPHLAQVALRRQPVAAAELAAGGVVELWPDAYADRFLRIPRAEGTPAGYYLGWLEHELYFTTNPSLYRRELIDAHRWPDAPGSEAAFTAQLRDAGYRFALWGQRDDGPWVQHTGTIRKGRGY